MYRENTPEADTDAFSGCVSVIKYSRGVESSERRQKVVKIMQRPSTPSPSRARREYHFVVSLSASLPHPWNHVSLLMSSMGQFTIPFKLQIGDLDLCKVHASNNLLHLTVGISKGFLKLFYSFLK